MQTEILGPAALAIHVDSVVTTSPSPETTQKIPTPEIKKPLDRIPCSIDDVRTDLLRHVDPALQRVVWSRIAPLVNKQLKENRSGSFSRSAFTELYAKVGAALVAEGNLARIHGLDSFAHSAQIAGVEAYSIAANEALPNSDDKARYLEGFLRGVNIYISDSSKDKLTKDNWFQSHTPMIAEAGRELSQIKGHLVQSLNEGLLPREVSSVLEKRISDIDKAIFLASHVNTLFTANPTKIPDAFTRAFEGAPTPDLVVTPDDKDPEPAPAVTQIMKPVTRTSTPAPTPVAPVASNAMSVIVPTPSDIISVPQAPRVEPIPTPVQPITGDVIFRPSPRTQTIQQESEIVLPESKPAKPALKGRNRLGRMLRVAGFVGVVFAVGSLGTGFATDAMFWGGENSIRVVQDKPVLRPLLDPVYKSIKVEKEEIGDGTLYHYFHQGENGEWVELTKDVEAEIYPSIADRAERASLKAPIYIRVLVPQSQLKSRYENVFRKYNNGAILLGEDPCTLKYFRPKGDVDSDGRAIEPDVFGDSVFIQSRLVELGAYDINFNCKQ